MSSLKTIYLEPICPSCVGTEYMEGRMWCEDDIWTGACENCGEPVESIRYYLAEESDELRRENDKLKDILSKLVPEKSGHYFICGQLGKTDQNGLPDGLMVCPAYGSDVIQVYSKREEDSK